MREIAKNKFNHLLEKFVKKVVVVTLLFRYRQ